jgi:hypothetical protein
MRVAGTPKPLTSAGILIRLGLFVLVLGLLRFGQRPPLPFRNDCPNRYQKKVIEPLTLLAVIVQKHLTRSRGSSCSTGRQLKTLQLQNGQQLVELQDSSRQTAPRAGGAASFRVATGRFYGQTANLTGGTTEKK